VNAAMARRRRVEVGLMQPSLRDEVGFGVFVAGLERPAYRQCAAMRRSVGRVVRRDNKILVVWYGWAYGSVFFLFPIRRRRVLCAPDAAWPPFSFPDRLSRRPRCCVPYHGRQKPA